MFLVPRKQIWTSQPQGRVNVDADYQDGLIACFHASTLSDLSGQKNNLTYTLSANLERVVGSAGHALLYQNNTPTLYYANAGGLISAAKSLVISAVVQKQYAGNGLIVFSAWANNIYQALCQINPDGSILWGVYQDAGNILLKITAAGVVPTGRPIRLVVGFEHGELSCFIDGSPVAFVSNGWVAGSPTQVNAYGANNLAFGGHSDGSWFAGTIYHLAAWTRGGLPEQDISANPWQIFKRPDSRIFVPVSAGGGTNATGSGSFSALYVTAPTASASASASASGALAALTISPATGSASAGLSANASGALASISIGAPVATASASASASGAIASISLSPATATASAGLSATASGSLAALSIAAPTATASGTTAGNAIAIATPAQITISPATAAAIGSAVASGSFAAVSVTAPTATADTATHAQAVATFAALSINPATGAAYGSAIATGSLPVISLSAATGTASNGVDMDEQYPLAGLSQSRPLAGLQQTYPLGN